MSGPSPFNPYAAPEPGYAPEVKVPASGRPGWYTFYCIAAIVLGSLGLANGLMGTVGVVFSAYVQPAMMAPGGAQPGMEEFQEINNQMNAEMMAITRRYFYFLLAAQLILVGVAACLLIGGVRALQMQKSGAKFLATAFMVTSVFDVARLVVTVIHQMETSQVMQKHFGPLMEAAQPKGGTAPPPQLGQIMSTTMTAAFGVAICFMVGWTIVKLWIYLSGWIYLQKPEIQALLKD